MHAEVFEVRKGSGFRVRAGQTDYRCIISLRPVFISVKFNTSAFHFLTFALAGLLVMGCDSTGTSSETPPPDEGGVVSLSLVRTANSDVPSDADSAFVRVWQPSGSFNLVEFVNIPDPGQQTEVSLDVPANQGYRAGILAVTAVSEFDASSKQILAHGSSGTFTVQSDDTSQVDLEARVADLTLEAPESIPPSRTDTIRAVYGINPTGLDPFIYPPWQNSNPTFGYGSGSELNGVGVQRTDTTESRQFEINAPNVSSEDTTYVKVRVTATARQGATWTTANRRLGGTTFPSENGPSFAIPVVPGSGDDDGTVIITFSRDGDSWEKTRRVVE